MQNYLYNKNQIIQILDIFYNLQMPNRCLIIKKNKIQNIDFRCIDRFLRLLIFTDCKHSAKNHR